MKDRRAFPRLPLHLPVRLEGKRSVRWAQTLTKDISLKGLRCLLEEDLWPVGTTVGVEIPLFKTREPFTCVATIIYVDHIPHSDHYAIGLHFHGMSADAERQIETFLKQAKPSAAPPTVSGPLPPRIPSPPSPKHPPAPHGPPATKPAPPSSTPPPTHS